MKKGALLFILLICIASVNATTYYVSKNGADTNGGTSWADSWLTINKSNIATGADSLILVGDGLYIEAYTTGAEYLYLERNVANRTFQAQNQSEVTINGSSTSRVIRVQPNANNLSIIGFVLEGDGSTSSIISGIAGTGGVYLINNTLQNATVQGLDMTTLSIWKNITGNKFINTNYGLVSSGNNNTIIEGNNFSNSLSERAMRFNEGRSVNITIKYNQFYDPDDVPVYLDDVGHEGWLIAHNLFGTQEEPIRVAAVDVRNSSNVVIQNNTFWQGNVTANWASIYCAVKNCSNIKIYGNHWGNATNYTNITGAGGVGYLMYLINATNGSIENNTAFMIDGNGINVVGSNNGVTEYLKVRYNNLTYEPSTIPPNRYGIKIGADSIATATGDINHTLIEHNRIIAPALATSKHMLFTGATFNSTVRYNYVVGAGYGILSKHDTNYVAHNNTMINQTNFENFVTRAGHNITVFNNTFFAPYYNETEWPYAIVAKNADSPARNVTNLTIHNNLFYIYNISPAYAVSEHGTNYTNIGFASYNNTFIAENSSRRFARGPSAEYFNFTDFMDIFGFENDSIFSVTDEIPWLKNISNISIGNEQATIQWQTQESTNSTVLYGTDPSILTSTTGDSSWSLSHNVTITSLTPGTMHFFNVSSCDYESNCNLSITYNFTTTGTAPTTPSSPGSSSSAKTYDESDSQSSTEYDLYWTDVTSGDYVKFNYEDNTYKLKVSRVYSDYAKVMLIPGNTYYEIPYGEDNLLDIDSNEGSDIEVKAEAEQFYQVSIYLNIEIGPELEDILDENTNTTNQTPTGGTVIDTDDTAAWKYFPIVIIVLAIGYMVWIKIYKKKN